MLKVQGATIERSPPLLQSIIVEGVNVLLSHPVLHMILKNENIPKENTENKAIILHIFSKKKKKNPDFIHNTNFEVDSYLSG